MLWAALYSLSGHRCTPGALPAGLARVYEPQIRARLGTAAHFCRGGVCLGGVGIVVLPELFQQALQLLHRSRLPEGTCKATWKREFKLPWREAGPTDDHDHIEDSDEYVVNIELSLLICGLGLRFAVLVCGLGVWVWGFGFWVWI